MSKLDLTKLIILKIYRKSEIEKKILIRINDLRVVLRLIRTLKILRFYFTRRRKYTLVHGRRTLASMVLRRRLRFKIVLQ